MEKQTVVVLGTFDGVHKGHAALFDMAVKLAEKYDLETVVYTFSNSPSELFSSQPVKLLCSAQEKAKIIRSYNIDRVEMDVFTKELCNTSCRDFAQMLKNRFNIKYAVAGYNYTFGTKASGNIELLRELGYEYGFEVAEAAPVLYKGKPISSTRIRQCIENGELEDANAQLGRCFSMTGEVKRCRQIGRTIGFPTVNIVNEIGYPILPYGVYATRVNTDGRIFNGVTNVGNNPTFGSFGLTVETHIFDFNEELYGKQITVEFIKYLRAQQRFDSVDELVKQISTDKSLAIKIHSEK